jgi:hypothetical protein
MYDILVKNISNIVQATDLMRQNQDVMSKLQESAMGAYITTPNTDKVYAFGYSLLNIGIGTQVTLGPGLVRSGTILSEVSFSNSNITLLSNFDNEITNYYPTNSNKSILDMYVLGSIYLVMTDPTFGDNPTPLLGNLIVTYTNPVLTVKNDNIDEIKNKLFSGKTPSGMFPSLSNNQSAVELYKFVVDLTSYSNISMQEHIIADTYIYDVKRNQCYPGYADEGMATNLLPAIIKTKELVDSAEVPLDSGVLKLVRNWAQTYPNFATYWTGNPMMPENLREYVLLKFGISL